MRNPPVEAIESWWQEFFARKDDIAACFRQQTDWDLAGWMRTHLQAIHPALMWEFGPAVHCDGDRLVITPQWRRDLRPLVKEILARAPRVEGWEFYPYRLAEDYEATQATVEARSGGDIADVSFRTEVSEVNKIDLTFFSRRYASPDDQQALHDVFVAAETLLGEETLDRWIGAIEVRKAGWLKKAERPIRELKAAVDERIAEVRSRLPDRPYWQLSEEQAWSGFKLEPEEQGDYPRQLDQFVGISMVPAMWINAHRPESFDSVRFSRFGETFCYVKLDGSEPLEAMKFQDREEIENALDAALKPAGLGCVVGGGTGLRYSYMDLALMDVDKAITPIRHALREGNVGKRSWLLFHDTDLQSEWLGIWDDSPQPPMEDFEAQ